MKLWVGARNCCPIEECHTECFMFGHPTLLGWVAIIMLFIGMIILFSLVREKNHEPTKNT